jgi:hypothetical protein
VKAFLLGMEKTDIKDFSLDELEGFLQGLG